MEQHKIINLSKKMEPLFRVSNSDKIQELYDFLFLDLYPKHQDFFDKLTRRNILDLVIFVYSLKKTGNLDYAADILDNLFFSAFVVTENQESEEECSNCDGNGTITCDYCDGDGVVECSECDGDGTVECSNCDGTSIETCTDCDGDGDIDGETCNSCGGEGGFDCTNCDEGQEKCSNCSGSGKEDCNHCDDGYLECNYCYGSGMEKSEYKIDFSRYTIVSWNKILKDTCELRVETDEPVISEDKFNELDEKIIIEHNTESYEPEISLEDGMLYCYLFETEPSIFRGSQGKVRLRDSEEFEYYFT